MISDQKQTNIHLKAPDLSEANFVAVVSRIQPYRKGGIRLQHQELKNKHIFHNYGHGGSGISLAYSSVLMSVRSMFTFLNIDKPYDCAVIGSGLIAMLTAVQLARGGHYPIVYADKYATFGQKQYSRKTASQVDEGLWLPFSYDLTNKLKHELLSKVSYEYYKQCMQISRFQSFKVAKVYLRDMTIKQIKQRIPGFIYNGYKKVNVDFGNGSSEPYTKLETVKINTELYMEELRVQATLRGVKFVQRKFNSQEDILNLNQQIIFNCMGYSSRVLFNDKDMSGNMDHLIIFKNPSNLEYTVDVQLKKDLHMRVHCSGDKVILRSETPIQTSTKEFSKKLVQQANLFFNQKKTGAKL